jgi:alkylhydroperoxidase family enzyme
VTSWRVPAAELPDAIGRLLSSRGAAQSNLYRVLANSPEMAAAWAGFIWALRDEPTTPRPLRELVILRTAQRHRSGYEWHHHVAMALRAGVSEEQVAAIGAVEASSCWSEAERTALELTDAVCDGQVPDEIAASALGCFGSRAYVELCLTAAAYSMVARMLAALAVPLEPGVEAVPPPWEAG